MAEDLLALHTQVPDLPRRHTAIDEEKIAVTAVRMQVGGKDALIGSSARPGLSFEYDCTRAVAKQDTG
jgi:hypothetical protein